MDITVLGKWVFYSSTKDFNKGPYYGEWLVFFGPEHYPYVEEKCRELVSSGMVKWAKHSTKEEVSSQGHGLLAVKLEHTDVEFVDGKPVSDKHRQVLLWLIRNGFVKKTKTGKYTNIRFKLDSEDKGSSKGKVLKGFTLSDFLDLYSEY